MYRISFAIVLLLLIVSCKKTQSGNNSNDSINGDSAGLAEELTREVGCFPDTSYLSENDISYKIDIIDTTINGEINSLKELYVNTPGAFMFRKDSRRDADFGGKINGKPEDFEIMWRFQTKEDYTKTQFGTWGGGTGWTGQPLLVEWPDSLLKRLRGNNMVYPSFKGKEIISGSLYGSVYFIDFESGEPSREAIDAGNPIKGTPSLDPTLNGNLYVGQGVNRTRPFGVIGIDLFSNKRFFMFAEDGKAWRHWGAYDSSPVRVGQFLFWPAENGGIYKYYVAPGEMKLQSVLRYKVNGAAPGIESSMSVLGNYGFTTDNHGNVICTNLNTMKPVWLYKLGDDTDATNMVTEENGRYYIYAGCEIDRSSADHSNFVKLDALTGQEIWKTEVKGKKLHIGEKQVDGGYFASPLPGKGDCEDMIFSNCVKNTDGQNGVFLAFDRKTGKVLYETPLRRYAWSSPVGFLDQNGKMYIVTGDCAGNMYCIDGKTGEILFSKSIGANFESSPVVKDDMLVVGSRGNSIYKIKVKTGNSVISQ